MQDSERQLPSMTCATADIYWAKMDTDSPGWTEAETFWTQWSPTGDEVYSEAFQNVEGNIWELQMGDLFVGKPGGRQRKIEEMTQRIKRGKQRLVIFPPYN
ncbi:uncharacterized protein LOC133483479 [Phyllopteryx taeniolatus]|uniref:uncharacterized protein LOC133483479 n=1 Tax=Phyllopteryx taeniolatus TaxID=161469 RepID=UPI002AD2BF49|nr:uncharacterized protein LOC133483479 [Phyllopteryx taeniolatus]